MVTMFWDMHVVLLLHFSPPNETVNSAAYQATLKKLKRDVLYKRPQMSDKRVLLLQDNAWPHKAHATVNLLEWWGWGILEHLPYSPDLAPSDFHLFPNMKKHLQPKRFKSHDESSTRRKRGCMVRIPPSINRILRNGFPCLDKCLNREGDCGKISDVKYNKWIKRHLTMWSYLAAIK